MLTVTYSSVDSGAKASNRQDTLSIFIRPDGQTGRLSHLNTLYYFIAH